MLPLEDNTMHAPSVRLNKLELEQQVNPFQNNELLKQAFNSVSVSIIVINRFRQALFLNHVFLNMIKEKSGDLAFGKRPGEILNCIHSRDHSGGCGTSEACRYCNLVNSVLEAIETKSNSSGEIVLTIEVEGNEVPLNLYGMITPIKIENETFYVVSLVDISDMKTKKMLERVFFHDILNTSGALRGLVSLLKKDIPDEYKEEVEFVEDNFSGLVETIINQRQIMEAENNELEIDIVTLRSEEVINSLVKLYKNHEVAKGKELIVSEDTQSLIFKSDLRILKRVIENMIKNALEESDKDDTVLIGCRKFEENIEFWVNNKREIPRSIQLQIFQRSFSTKGNGRGLGTYSMKLFGEKILKGKVSFTSDEKNGTTFYFRFVG